MVYKIKNLVFSLLFVEIVKKCMFFYNVSNLLNMIELNSNNVFNIDNNII